MFFNEIDEGLWFYAKGFQPGAGAGSHPRYNTAFDLAHSFLTERRHSETSAISKPDGGARKAGAHRLAGPSRSGAHAIC